MRLAGRPAPECLRDGLLRPTRESVATGGLRRKRSPDRHRDGPLRRLLRGTRSPGAVGGSSECRRMKSVWIIRVTITVMVVALAVWIARNTYWDEVEIPMPAQGEAASNPFYTQQHLVEALGAHSLWQRVPGAIPPPQGVLVLSNFNWSLIDVRRERIQKWVEAGGRLVIDRSVIGGEDELTRWTGISRYSVVRRKPQSPGKADPDGPNADSETPEDVSGNVGPTIGI